MKRIILFFFMILIGSVPIISQVPQAMSYKAIAKDDWGVSLPNKLISLRFTILQGDDSGLPVYIEVHSTKTTKYGMINVQIGEGVPIFGSFSNIDWSAGIFFIKIEMDPKGGSNYCIVDSPHQLLSVPYALFAESSGDTFSGNYEDLYNKPTKLSNFTNDLGFLTTENDPVFKLHPSSQISYENLANWNSAYSWGNHAGLYKPVGYVPTWNEVTDKPFDINLPASDQLIKYNSITGKWENWTPNYLISEVDGSITNEIQTLTLTGNELTISGPEQNIIRFINWDTDLTNDVNISDDQNIGGTKVFTGTIKVPSPVGENDAASKAYVDALKQEIKLEIYAELGVSDIDGNHYNTVKIGKQVWMAENLKTTRFNNGDLIGTTIPAILDLSGETLPKYQWAYDGDENKVAVNGRLYTWYAVMDNRNLCPKDWHVPTDAEWSIMVDYLTSHGYGYEGTGNDIAKAISAASGWTTDLTLGNVGNDQNNNNSSGFNAFPSGFRKPNGSFIRFGSFTGWWSTTESNSVKAWYRSLDYNTSYLNRSYDEKKYGGSVRCIKD
jgi:uncharacterized protein (TIGR02145 family)